MKKKLIKGNHTIGDFRTVLKEFERDKDIQSVLVLAAAGNKFEKQAYDEVLKEASLPITGGIFPEVIFEGKRYSEGTVLAGFDRKMKTVEVDSSAEEDQVVEALVDGFAGESPHGKAIFIFVNGLIAEQICFT